jgi:hypothetical protein
VIDTGEIVMGRDVRDLRPYEVVLEDTNAGAAVGRVVYHVRPSALGLDGPRWANVRGATAGTMASAIVPIARGRYGVRDVVAALRRKHPTARLRSVGFAARRDVRLVRSTMVATGLLRP